MQARKGLLRAGGTTLSRYSQSQHSSVLRSCLEESICHGGLVDGAIIKTVRAVFIQSANFGSRRGWDSSGLLSGHVKSGRARIWARPVSSVVEVDQSSSEPKQHDGDATGQGPALEEESSSSQDVVEEESSRAGTKIHDCHTALAESVVQEIRQRLAKRRALGGEDTSRDHSDSIIHELRDKVAGIDAELDVAGKVLKQAFEILEADGYVPETEQRSLSVAVVGAPNAGKSALTNQLVGSKTSAVSRKTNITHSDHLGVYTEGDAQLVIHDTPGLTIDARGYPIRSSRIAAVDSAWQMTETCEALVIVVDAHRHIARADKRVERLTRKLAGEDDWEKKRVLCLNKVDLIEDKKALLPLAEEFSNLACFDRIFMISSKTGSGVKDVRDYLVDQAILRIWAYEPNNRTQRLQEDLALEVVREHLYDRLHMEVPYAINHRHVSWETRVDGSIRIEQQLIVAKKDHKKILIGKGGELIRKIGTSARLDLQKLLDCPVHLRLNVRTKEGSWN